MFLKPPKCKGVEFALKCTQHAFFLPYRATVCSSEEISSSLEFCLILEKHGTSMNLVSQIKVPTSLTGTEKPLTPSQ